MINILEQRAPNWLKICNLCKNIHFEEVSALGELLYFNKFHFLYCPYKILHFCILLYHPIMNISAFGNKKLKKGKQILYHKKQVARSCGAPVKNVSSANCFHC